MREISVVTPKSGYRLSDNAVRRLQFNPTGEGFAAWVGYDGLGTTRTRQGFTQSLHSHDLRTGETRPIEPTGYYAEVGGMGERAVSPDGRFLAFQYDTAGWASVPSVALIDLTQPDSVIDLDTGVGRLMEFAFTPDGETLLATRNAEEDRQTYDLVQIPVKNLTGPPRRVVPAVNPLTALPYMRVVRDTRWRRVVPMPEEGRGTALGVSADGRLVAVGTAGGRVLVADLKRKRVAFDREWKGRARGNRVVDRVGFDPRAEWVTMQADGRVFAEPMKPGVGKGWATLGSSYITDFAYHPAGGILAVADVDGSARFLDPLSGKVLQTFRWRRGPLYSIAFSPDGLVCAAGAGGGRVILWDVDV